MVVVVIRPKCKPRLEDIDGTLTSMQQVVGGYIECIPLFWALPEDEKLTHPDLMLVCNEEGKLKHLDRNIDLSYIDDYIAGTCFICKGDGEEFVSLSAAEAAYVMCVFARDGDEPCKI